MPVLTECVLFDELKESDTLLSPNGFYVGVIQKITKEGMWVDRTPVRVGNPNMRLLMWIPRRENGVAIFNSNSARKNKRNKRKDS